MTEAQLRQLLAPTHEVPLRPMRWPADPTRHHVAPGVVVAVAGGGDGTYEVFAGSRQRSALRPFRPFFA